jgi:hypothetical protein
MTKLGTDEPNPHDPTKPPQCDRQPEPWWDFKASHWVTAFLTGALVFVGILQYSVYSRQAGIMEADQRASIVITAGHVGDHGSTMYCPITVSNMGKTVARHIVVNAVVDVLKSSEAPTFSYDVPHLINRQGAMFPNSPTHLEVPTYVLNAQGQTEVRNFSQSDISELTEGKDYVVVYVQVDYLDRSGKPHWTHYCSFAGSAITGTPVNALACAKYNDVDDN